MMKPSGWFKKRAAEENRHVKLLRVRYSTDTDPLRQSRIVAAQLRVLALNTDGQPSVLGAFDAELMERGMRFRFTSQIKRDEFKGRVQNYLSKTVTSRLTFSA